jgi:hypothetical protein
MTFSQKDPIDNFTIKAHRPSPTTSVPVAATATAATASSIAVEITREEPKPVKIKRSSWTSIKSKGRIIFKNLVKKQPIATSNNATATASPSSPSCTSAPPLTITVPEPCHDHQPSLESPSDRVKRVASTAINNLGRAFSSCLPLSAFSPKSPPSSTFDQNLETIRSPSDTNHSPNTKNSRYFMVKFCVENIKTKGKKLKNSLKKNNIKINPQQNNSNTIFFAANTLDDMMDKMIDTINKATGRNNRFKTSKVVKKLWKSTSKWIGF